MVWGEIRSARRSCHSHVIETHVCYCLSHGGGFQFSGSPGKNLKEQVSLILIFYPKCYCFSLWLNIKNTTACLTFAFVST